MSGRIAYYGNIVKDGLILDLDAAKRDSYPGTGTTWSDISGNGNNGTLTNGPTYSSANAGSIKFNGSNSYVLMGSNSLLDLTGAFTLSTWFKFNTLASATMLLSRARSGGFAYTFFQFSSGKPRLLLQNGAGSFDATSPNTYSIGNIYNFVTVLTVSQATHYVNGILDSTITNSSGILPNYTNVTTNNWTLGGNPYNITAYGDQNQYISQIYNRALTSSEVLQNYNALKSRFGLT